MADRDVLAWPFFAPEHRVWAAEVDAFARQLPAHDEDVDRATIELTRALGEAGLLRAAVPEDGRLSVRHLCLARDILARHDGLADFAFAMAGLGTGAITLFGTPALKSRYLPAVRRGEALAAFALSEPEAGSDVAAITTAASRDRDGSWRINGEKTWISNGGLAAVYVVVARTGEGPGTRGLSAFVVPGSAPGLTVAERIAVAAPHPLARLRFEDVRVPGDHCLGAPGEGFRIAMTVLDHFRPTVGAAAVGFARRALALSLARATSRRLFGSTLFDHQMTQDAVASMATEIDAAALLVYRAAWLKDGGAERISREASMAKLFATEAAQRAADRCVQLHGGLGVVSGSPPEVLWREVRALRVYEGASEIQKLVIARAERDRAAAPPARVAAA